MEVEIDRPALDALLGSAAPMVADYSIGFALPTIANASLDATLGGSGTLVSIDGTRGIMTASHVVASLKKNEQVGLILPTRFRPLLHHISLELTHCDEVAFAPIGEEFERPDLALLIPPPDILSTLAASKSFYNLSQFQKRMLEAPPAMDLGLWALAGLAGEWSSDGLPEKGYSRVKIFRGKLLGALDVIPCRYQDDFDYLSFKIPYNALYKGPERFRGYSGGGLWQLLVKPDHDKLRITDLLLSGLAFYEMGKEHDEAGRVTRKIICHGRRSVYQAFVNKVRTRHS